MYPSNTPTQTVSHGPIEFPSSTYLFDLPPLPETNPSARLDNQNYFTSPHAVIPSNIYAPHTLPLHSPKPLSLLAPLAPLTKSPPEQQLRAFSTSASKTFPTPSELLKNLATNNSVSELKLEGCLDFIARPRKSSTDKPSISPVDTLSQMAMLQSGLVLGAPSSSPTSSAPSSLSFVDSSSTTVIGNASPTGLPPFSATSRSNTISSHDKKRYYLDSLEQYVLYLHQQLRLVGIEPTPIEKVKSAQGLSSRSIRTMIVHMQKSIATLHAQKQEAQQQYDSLLIALQLESDFGSSSM